MPGGLCAGPHSSVFVCKHTDVVSRCGSTPGGHTSPSLTQRGKALVRRGILVRQTSQPCPYPFCRLPSPSASYVLCLLGLSDLSGHTSRQLLFGLFVPCLGLAGAVSTPGPESKSLAVGPPKRVVGRLGGPPGDSSEGGAQAKFSGDPLTVASRMWGCFWAPKEEVPKHVL